MTKTDDELKKMTLTVQNSDEVRMLIAGTGTMTIDWGDKTNETYSFLAFDEDEWEHSYNNTITVKDGKYVEVENIEVLKYGYRHTYSDESTHTVIITGKNITHLYCDGNQITSLDVSANAALVSLSCNGNELTDLNLHQNTQLQELQCSTNQLSYLDVSNNTNLFLLSCNDNQLTNLDTSKNVALEYLCCDMNQLTTLDVSKNFALECVTCQQNQLTGLDVSNLIALRQLDCSQNQIKTLDISNNNLKDFHYIQLSDCKCKNVELKGRVKIVKSGADFKVKIVDSFADLRVKKEKSFPINCGEWQFVDSGEDFTIQFVSNFPDFTIMYVEQFPGVK